MDSLTIFILGGYSGPLGFGLSDNFHFEGGILNLSDLDSLTIFILWGWGGILNLSDLDSLTTFILGGYSEPLGFGLSDNFHLGGGGYSEPLGFGLSDNFHFGGVLNLSDLDSLTISIFWRGVF